MKSKVTKEAVTETALVKLQTEAGRLAQGFQVNDEAGLNVGALHRLRLNDARKKIVAFFKPMKDAAKETLEQIREKEKGFLGPIDKAEGYIKEEMQRFLNAAREERQKLEDEQRKRQEAYEQKLATAKNPGRVKEPEALVIPDAPKIEGSAQVVEWKFEVVDIRALPAPYWIPNFMMIGQEVREKKEEAKIPGVRIWSEIAVRRRG